MYYSEIGKIIEAGLERDKDKVASFAQLLAKKMAADGEERGSKRIGDILERKNRSKAVTDSLIAPPPVDQESRMNIVEIDYQPVVNDLILSKAVELKLMDFMETINNKEKMDQIGLEFNMSLLLYGHPGCGKTSAAKYIASQLGLPLVVARLDTLISSLLGNTAKNIHKIFEFAKKQPCVLFLDEFGKKLLITGKGRCNVTNNCGPDEFLKNVRRNPRFLYSALNACPPAFVMELLEKGLGVPLKTERGRRVFPQSDRAQDVLDALLRWAKGARLRYEGARELMLENGRCTGVRLQSGEALRAGAVLVATGGVSYPVTGSTGDGYRFARQAGHTVMPPEPSLVSLVGRGGVCRRMMGLSLKNVALTLYEGKKALFCEQGEMLFTHFGMSGPLVLSASAHIRDMKKYGYRVCIDLKPALPPEKLYKRVSEDFALLANREAANCLVKLLPASMQPVMLDVWGMDPQRKVNQITREDRRRLVELLKAFPVELAGKGDLAHAVVTSGGVSVKEVDPKTMQSKLCPGLYFAGEVLDVDAYTGGYNLGIAFATAYAAASHL